MHRIGTMRRTFQVYPHLGERNSYENRRPFASVLIQDRSIKLVLRTQHRIANQRILSIDRVANKSYDHTIVLDSINDINDELMKWLGEAYHSSD